MQLTKLMKKGWIYEGILQTGGHFSAMGFWTEDMRAIKIKLYRSAKTYELLAQNMKRQKAALRLPRDVSDFFLLAAGAKGKQKLSALPAIKLALVREAKKPDFSIFSFRLASEGRALPPLINRAPMLALECLIDHSRERDFSAKLAAIRRVAPGSAFARQAARLKRHGTPRKHY